jgi:membrane protein implicated in regulation of membrane protease activity
MHQQPKTSIAVAFALILLGAVMLCHCWFIFALAALFAAHATWKSKGIFRAFSAGLLVLCVAAAYFDSQNELSVHERAREAVRKSEENQKYQNEK